SASLSMRRGLWPEASQPSGSMAANSSWVGGCQLQRRFRARTRSGSRAAGTVGSTVSRRSGLMTPDYTSAPTRLDHDAATSRARIGNNAVTPLDMTGYARWADRAGAAGAVPGPPGPRVVARTGSPDRRFTCAP